VRVLIVFAAILALSVPTTAALASVTGDVLSALFLELIAAISLAACLAGAADTTTHSHTNR